MEYGGYDYQGYQDPYAQDPYAQDPYAQDPYGYGGYYDEYGYDNFQPDGSPPPPPDKDWEDPALLNRSYLEKLQKDIVLEDYKGLNDQNMYLVEVLVSNFEIKNEVADSDPFKDKNGEDFFTSVKILHCPFLEVTDSNMKGSKLLRKKAKSERVPSYTDLFQTVYTEADPPVYDEQSEDPDEPEESEKESMRDTPRVSIKERLSTVKEEKVEEPPKDTKSYPLGLGKNVLFTMTGLSMLQTIMEHEIRVRLSERVTVDVTESEVDNSPRTSTVETAEQDNPKSSKDSQRVSLVSHVPETASTSKGVTKSVEGATLGTASVRMSSMYHQALLGAALPDAAPPFHAPESRTEEYHPLVNSEGEEIGTVGLSIFMICLGRAAVNCVRETIREGYEFEHTLFLNKARFEPPKKAEEPPNISPKLATFVLKLGPVMPLSKTSTEILQECFDKNLLHNNDNCETRRNKTDCDWSTITTTIQRRVLSLTGSARTAEESVPDLEQEMEQDLGTRWIDLRRICREMQDKMINDEWDESKERSLYDRLEEMRMPVDDLGDDEDEGEVDSDEEITRRRKSSLATSHSNNASLKSNSSRKKTI